jgi:16S rRNA (guanine527-N7)-methyltransferase
VAVIEHLASAARIANARPLHLRAEDWAREAGREAYDVATARAVAPLPVLLEYASPLLREGGLVVAWRGVRNARDEDAAAQVAPMVGLEPTDVLQVAPFEGARARHLHLYLKASPTPDRFPRRAGAALKRPLV